MAYYTRIEKKEIEASPYGHWDVSICGDFDPRDSVAFIYAIHLKDGSRYIGVKKFWTKIKKPPSHFKRGPQKKLTEHKWRSYVSSSAILNDTSNDLVEGRYILGVYEKWGIALMAEFMFQYHLDAMRKTHFLNFQMSGHFSKSTYPPEETLSNIEKYKIQFNEV